MKRLLVVFLYMGLCTLTFTTVKAQKLITRNGHIWFHSSTPIEDIEAHTYQAMSVLDTEKGDMAFAILMKSFQFEKALMQEHFNEKYVESEKYPKATFQGRVTNWEDVDLESPGTYAVNVEGNLEIHGETHPIASEGKFTIDDEQINGTAAFSIQLVDYKIKVPSVVRDNIAEEIDIMVDVNFEKTSDKS